MSKFRKIQTTLVNVGQRHTITVPVIPNDIDHLLYSLQGEIQYPLTNDRMFRGIMSYSVSIREGFVRALMGISPSDPLQLVVMNPVSFGHGPSEKETIEDVRLLVNNTMQINIELQNYYLADNNPRFLLYLCCNYNSLGSGKNYNELKSALQIGILSYSQEDKIPEFYAKYRLVNVRTGEPLFSSDDYFGLNMLDLTQIDEADEDDKRSGRLLVAQLFRAKTWEELKSLADTSTLAKEVAEIMAIGHADSREQYRLEAHRRYLETQATIKDNQRRLEKAVADARSELAKAQSEVATLQAEKDKAEAENKRLRELLESLGYKKETK